MRPINPDNRPSAVQGLQPVAAAAAAAGRARGRTCCTTLLFFLRSSALRRSYSWSVTMLFPAWYARDASRNFCSVVLPN